MDEEDGFTAAGAAALTESFSARDFFHASLEGQS